jgi:spermidine/putrescine transport system permease protein
MQRLNTYLQAYSLLSPSVFWLGVFFLGPLGIVLVYSFCLKGVYGGIEYTFTFENYVRAINPTYLKIVVRSFRISASITLLCLLMGYPIAYYIATRTERVKNLLLMLVIIPFWTNFLIRTYAWISILRADGIINSMLRSIGFIGPDDSLPLLYNEFAIHLGQVYGYLPFMILPLYSSIEKLDFKLLEAAGDLGADSVQSFLRVTLPLTLPGIVAGSILVFVPALGDFITPSLLGGAKSIMIGNLVEDQFLASRDWPFGSALSFILMVVVLGSLMFYIRLSGTEQSRMDR